MTKKKQDIQGKDPYILQIRNYLDLPQDVFAKMIGIRQNTLSRWETKGIKPKFTIKSFPLVIQVLQDLNLTYSDIPDDVYGKIKIE